LINSIKNFLNNEYPIQFIFSTIKKWIKFYINNYNNTNNKLKDKFFIVSFVNTVFEKFVSIANMFNCKLAYTIPNIKEFNKKRERPIDHKIRMLSIKSRVVIAINMLNRNN